MKKLLLIISILVFPLGISAYSNEIAIGGETIGIEVNSNGVYVVGFYNINDKNIGEASGFKIGDIIKEVNNKKIENISSLNNIIKEEGSFPCIVKRNDKEIELNLEIIKDNDILKTGLFVKDKISGIGTLSYIDPNTKIFGSLGHEILESTSFQKFEIKDGSIFPGEVSSIRKSDKAGAGEKNATYDKNNIIGNIRKNEISGIYGIYKDSISNKSIFQVANKEEIKKGPAKIRTVINNNEVKEFNINILGINEDTTKNIFFEVTDEELLNKTGGIVQGMSGSPIIQNNKIIGVVNYVIVEEVNKGYGIFITTMLEEGDKLVD